MTTAFVLNLILAAGIVTALASVCRVAYRVAGGLLDSALAEPAQLVVDERLAA